MARAVIATVLVLSCACVGQSPSTVASSEEQRAQDADARVPAAPQAGRFNTRWDWWHGKRDLTYCIDQTQTGLVIASSVRTAAKNLTDSASGWRLTEIGGGGCGVRAGDAESPWSLRDPTPGQADIRVTAASLGAVAQRPGGGPAPDDYEGTDDDAHGAPVPGRPAPRGLLSGPPLAYFQPGPLVAGPDIQAGEIVFNLGDATVPGGIVPWDTHVGTWAYDPIRTAMHELGHAVRLLHYDLARLGFPNDDEMLAPTGSIVGDDAGVIGAGADGLLGIGQNRAAHTTAVADDVVADGTVTAGPDGVADSGKTVNVMETYGAVLGQHGCNPLVGFPADSRYSYTPWEIQAAQRAARHVPGAGAADMVDDPAPDPEAQDAATCAGLTREGICDGDVMTWCEGGFEQRLDCAAHGLACVPDEQGGFVCG